MINNISLAVAVLFASTHAYAVESLINVESHYSAKETADRFESIIKDKGFTVFARIDHQKNAAGVNLTLKPTEVIIFGNPNIGTQLMQCNQLVAIDLPQKVLVSEDADNKVWLSYNNPQYIKQRHSITGCDEVIDKISGALNTLSIAATSK
tara:strand:+ start:7637 stop:8089 length:453 start_codon:yes stop_codon:yes gene_type:complete